MAYNTVKIKKYVDIVNEGVAGGVITPGMLLEISGAGSNGNPEYSAHSTAEGAAAKFFALEDELQGKGIDDNYAANDPVQVWVAQAGEEVYAIVCESQTIAVGELLSSHGDGTLQKLVGSTAVDQQVVAVALEAVTTGAGATSRIRAMIV